VLLCYLLLSGIMSCYRSLSPPLPLPIIEHMCYSPLPAFLPLPLSPTLPYPPTYLASEKKETPTPSTRPLYAIITYDNVYYRMLSVCVCILVAGIQRTTINNLYGLQPS
jgi:hypothetical protein